MGLEIRVAPSSIRADHWAWMKRYRVWQANRKIFLYPENWLEPELRDGKSSFFSELESDLLKSDVTDELAENAFLAYLKKLDDVARLEIVGMYLQQGVADKPEDDLFHVFARTNGRTRQYWYRRFEYGSWTPWEKVTLNIEGDSVIPVIWRNQLYLFWLTTVVKPRGGEQDQADANMADQHWKPRSPVDVEITFNWGEYYNSGMGVAEVDEHEQAADDQGLAEFHPGDIVLAARTEKPANVAERLMFSLIYYHKSDVKAWKIVFTSKNAEPILYEDNPDATLARRGGDLQPLVVLGPSDGGDARRDQLEVPRKVSPCGWPSRRTAPVADRRRDDPDQAVARRRLQHTHGDASSREPVRSAVLLRRRAQHVPRPSRRDPAVVRRHRRVRTGRHRSDQDRGSGARRAQISRAQPTATRSAIRRGANCVNPNCRT